jgi:hypothetical protein
LMVVFVFSHEDALCVALKVSGHHNQTVQLIDQSLSKINASSSRLH